jgi:hypothetical protein
MMCMMMMTLVYLDIRYAEVSASRLSRMLSRPDRPLRCLVEVSLELFVIDSLELDSDAALPVLSNLLVIAGETHRVRLALASLRTVRLHTWRSPHEGSLTIECPLLEELEMRWFKKHAIRLTCPVLASLECLWTKVSPDELARWPEALPRLRKATVYGMDENSVRRALGHVPKLEYRRS